MTVPEGGVAVHDPALCEGCMVCVAACPTGAANARLVNSRLAKGEHIMKAQPYLVSEREPKTLVEAGVLKREWEERGRTLPKAALEAVQVSMPRQKGTVLMFGAVLVALAVVAKVMTRVPASPLFLEG
ncbi:hypothetical protein KIPB_012404 [Kipferlia bialata]|uniref:4Fe-4S ferredoxin-type domain-containing protein n=1 Tax=Kipferlia bialata TaxID=797122 RepID=A0A9K3D6K5_9EUKA|nr:hypothetical protein KIPB_012404 [Kipferlia bialata]|eukprot:g12404.t1